MAFGKPAQVVDEPVTGQLRHLFERAPLFEQMCGAGNNGEFALPGHRSLGSSVQFEDHLVASAHDQQSRRNDVRQRATGEIGPAAAGDNRADVRAGIGGRYQRRARPSTCAEVADRQ